MVGASLRQLLEQLHLVLFFDAVELTELVQLGHKRVDNLHAFEELRAALLVASVLLTLHVICLVPQIVDLVLQ